MVRLDEAERLAAREARDVDAAVAGVVLVVAVDLAVAAGLRRDDNVELARALAVDLDGSSVCFREMGWLEIVDFQRQSVVAGRKERG